MKPPSGQNLIWIPRKPCKRTLTFTSRCSAVSRRPALPQSLGLPPPFLLRQTAFTGRARRTRRSALLASFQSIPQQFDHPLAGGVAVGALRSLLLAHHPQSAVARKSRGQTHADARLLPGGEQLAVLEVKQQVRARADLVDVLAAGAGRARKGGVDPGRDILEAQVFSGNRQLATPVENDPLRRPARPIATALAQREIRRREV